MGKPTVVLHSAHRDQFPVPNRDLVFYDQPEHADWLSQITAVHLWSPPEGPVHRLPETITAMTSLRTLSIGPGTILPSVVTGLRQGDLPESLEELSVHIGDRSLVWPDVVVPNLTILYVGGPLRFTSEHFPRLRALSLYPQRSLNDVRQALGQPLEELNLLNVPVNEDVFRPGSARLPGWSRCGLRTSPRWETSRIWLPFTVSKSWTSSTARRSPASPSSTTSRACAGSRWSDADASASRRSRRRCRRWNGPTPARPGDDGR